MAPWDVVRGVPVEQSSVAWGGSEVEQLARAHMWRRCVKCSHMIELASGCFHVSCKCGYEFCYNCGAEWKKKKQTCRCPSWVEENILYGEQGRRR